jgi:hypothetical protein
MRRCRTQVGRSLRPRYIHQGEKEHLSGEKEHLSGENRGVVYERRADEHVLYSLGPDGDDDRGALPSDNTMMDGDLSLDFFTKVAW